MKLHGSSGELNASKIIKSVVNAIIAPELLQKHTMTGKSDKKDVKKLRFKIYVNVLKIVKRVLLAADTSYNEIKFRKDLTYKVMKYAYKM